MIDHLAKLIEAVSQNANYKPNETELKMATLQTKLDSLKTSNTDLVNRSLQQQHNNNTQNNKRQLIKLPVGQKRTELVNRLSKIKYG